MLLRFLLLILFFTSFILYSCDRTIPPKKFDSIPKEAFWAGGIDAGHWFKVNQFNDSIVNLSIYHDYNGELISTDNYKLCNECNNIKPSFKDLSKQIIAWGGDDICLNFTNTKTSRYCSLKKVHYTFNTE